MDRLRAPLHKSRGGGCGVESETMLSLRRPRSMERVGTWHYQIQDRHNLGCMERVGQGGQGGQGGQQASSGHGYRFVLFKVTQKVGRRRGEERGTTRWGNARTGLRHLGTQEQVKRDLQSGSWAMHTGSRHSCSERMAAHPNFDMSFHQARPRALDAGGAGQAAGGEVGAGDDAAVI